MPFALLIAFCEIMSQRILTDFFRQSDTISLVIPPTHRGLLPAVTATDTIPVWEGKNWPPLPRRGSRSLPSLCYLSAIPTAAAYACFLPSPPVALQWHSEGGWEAAAGEGGERESGTAAEWPKKSDGTLRDFILRACHA